MQMAKKLWDNIEHYLMIFFLGVFLVNITVQIVMRLFFNHPLSFTEEVSRYSFIWMVLLGLSYATKYDRHIRVDFFYNMFPKNIQFVVEIFLNILTLVVFIWVLKTGMEYVKYSSITRTYALNISKGYVVSILPICGGLMIIRVIEKMYRDFRNHFGISKSGEKV